MFIHGLVFIKELNRHLLFLTALFSAFIFDHFHDWMLRQGGKYGRMSKCVRKTACQMYYFCILAPSPPPPPKKKKTKTTLIMNLKNLDLDLIGRIQAECGLFTFMICFWISVKNFKSIFGFKESCFKFSSQNALKHMKI